MTNYERIKQMSIEEMATLLAYKFPHDCNECELECCSNYGDKFEDSCPNAFYKWLKRKYKND